MYLIRDASWKNPATYTIVEVPDLVIAESTITKSDKRNFTNIECENYLTISKYRIH